MKGILEFNLPEDQQEFEDAQRGGEYKDKIERVWNELFRPRRKHGYKDSRIQAIMEDEKCDKLMDYLEATFQEIVNEE